jgi:acyl-homoserine lactone acylase PvdQ
VRITVSADRSSSDLHDLQSLALHRAAFELMKKDDELRMRALAAVRSWQQNDPNSRTAALWSEWERILTKKALRHVLGRSARSQQLRQASPLSTILPADLRRTLLAEISQLKRGVVIARHPKTGPRN